MVFLQNISPTTIVFGLPIRFCRLFSVFELPFNPFMPKNPRSSNIQVQHRNRGVSAPPYPFPLHPKQQKPGDHPPLNIPMGWMINSRVLDLLDVRIAKGNPVRLSPGGVRRVPFGALYTASLTVGGGRDFEGKK